ncbi:hypothetical protein CBR_g37420 [Chara braunii]|uniref:Erythromycin esterase n=1 Tax=Chara braunii TaxID=69332 RepID=A0A388LMQ0_CHABU|nr:hypothetical protein CBR_g37420 [Chara braunii]|eukprot:GBG83616.1 hypothetical protein CBR_g37420 [Chara braunii]
MDFRAAVTSIGPGMEDRIRRQLVDLVNVAEDKRYGPVLDKIGDASIVLIGEASHGTHQFYRVRAELTQHLIVAKGFNTVAVEADWPDAYRVHRYVQHRSKDKCAERALADFQRFPTWMWRNTDVVRFVQWLRAHNLPLPAEKRVGFYGLDLYSLYRSIEAVINYLDSVDPDAAKKARYRYGCFEEFDQDPQQYGFLTNYGVSGGCEDEAIKQLMDMRDRAMTKVRTDGFMEMEEAFYAEQSARLVRNAERYYRAMFRGRDNSWNLRDGHMFETLEALMTHRAEVFKQPAKVVIWAHNSHLGNARFTEMSKRGELNIGQLIKEKYPDKCYSLGQTTYEGTVAAASNWGDPVERKIVRPALADSYEALFHSIKRPVFFLDLKNEEMAEDLRKMQLERAIGVIYRPRTERQSHYFYAQICKQFDGVIHFDMSDAVIPLEPTRQGSRRTAAKTAPGEDAARRTSGRRKGARAGGAAGGGGKDVRAGRSQSGEVEVGMEKWDRRGKSGSGDRGGDRWGEVGEKEAEMGREVSRRRSGEGGRRRELGSGERGGDRWREPGIGGELGTGGGKSDWGHRWISMDEVGGGMLGCGRKSTKGGWRKGIGVGHWNRDVRVGTSGEAGESGWEGKSREGGQCRVGSGDGKGGQSTQGSRDGKWGLGEGSRGMEVGHSAEGSRGRQGSWDGKGSRGRRVSAGREVGMGRGVSPRRGVGMGRRVGGGESGNEGRPLGGGRSGQGSWRRQGSRDGKGRI